MLEILLKNSRLTVAKAHILKLKTTSGKGG